jgi:putative ABC transport system permease protein
VAEALFPPGTDPSGKYITINGVSFRVVGVFYDSGWQGRMSERLYIPLSTYKKTFDKSKKVNQIAITPKPGVDSFKLEQAATDLLKSRHSIAPDDRRAIRANNLAERAQSFRNMFAAIDIFIWFVGIGTLMAGIVGISNIMIITVKDRTKEIGVRKALGATPASIIGLILLESVTLTAVAGYLGLVLGVGLLEGVQYVMQRMNVQAAYFSHPEVGFGTAVAATLLLVFVGAAAGLLPAMKAARVTPIEAMRADD